MKISIQAGIKFGLLLVAIGVGVLGCGESESTEQRNTLIGEAPGSGVCAGVTRAPAGTPTKLALLVGINTYPKLASWKQLKGAVNDVERMRALLTTRFEFPPENVTTLLNEAATRDSMLALFRNCLIANAQAGDIVVFHYSGHGSQLPDEPGGDESDGTDETLVPSDSDLEGSRDIRDDEINVLLRELAAKTPNITFIFDSCHSGTATRVLPPEWRGGRERSLDRDSLLQASLSVATRGPADPDGVYVEGLDYALISGARANQLSQELAIGSQTFGALTYYLTQTLSQANTEMTYADLVDVLRDRINEHVDDQSPQFEGIPPHNIVFNGASRVALPFSLVSKGGTGHVTLQAGAVHGLTSGSLFDVYPPSTRDFEPNAQIARLKLTRVGPYESEAEVMSGGVIPAAARAVERAHRYASQQIRLRYYGLEESTTLQAVKDSLDRLSYVVTVPEGDPDFDMRLYEKVGRIHVELDAVTFSETVPVAATDAVMRVIEQVKAWTSWLQVRALENPTHGSLVALHLRFENVEGSTRSPGNVVAGDRLYVTFENLSSQDLFVTAFALFSTGAMVPFYPQIGETRTVLRSGQTSEELALGAVSISGNRPYTLDLIKVFASTSDADLGGVIQGTVEVTGSNPLEELLAQVTRPSTRVYTTAPPINLDTWTTTHRAYVVRPNPKAIPQ